MALCSPFDVPLLSLRWPFALPLMSLRCPLDGPLLSLGCAFVVPWMSLCCPLDVPLMPLRGSVFRGVSPLENCLKWPFKTSVILVARWGTPTNKSHSCYYRGRARARARQQLLGSRSTLQTIENVRYDFYSQLPAIIVCQAGLSRGPTRGDAPRLQSTPAIAVYTSARP